MTSGSLTDLDPAAGPERRWPFYVTWTVGSFLVGAVLFTHLPASELPASAPLGAPAPMVTVAPAPFRVVIPIAPVPLRAPAVPTRTRR